MLVGGARVCELIIRRYKIIFDCVKGLIGGELSVLRACYCSNVWLLMKDCCDTAHENLYDIF